MKLAATTVDEFFQVPIAITEDLVQDLVDGLENLFMDYMKFVAACGKKLILDSPIEEKKLVRLIT